MWLIKDTTIQFTEDTKKGIGNSFFECEQWLYRGKIVEPTGTGRFITSGKSFIKFIILKLNLYGSVNVISRFILV